MIEILARLPIEVVARTKCVCKRWCSLIKSSTFCNAHLRKSGNRKVGTFLQGMYWCPCCTDVMEFKSVNFLGVDKLVKKNMLDFLPEKVVVAASCNGLVICRSLFRRNKDHEKRLIRSDKNPVKAKLFIYVCNPLTKEFRVLKPNLTNEDRCALGLAFNLSGTSYEVLVVQALENCYVFKIFSSKTNRWRRCKTKCYYSHNLFYQHHAFLNGVFYWLASGHSVLAFDLEKEEPHIIELPGPVLLEQGASGMCIGVSQGKIHYVTLTLNEFMVWTLTSSDYLNPQWQRIYLRYVYRGGTLLVAPEEGNVELCSFPNSSCRPHPILRPLGFKDDVDFMDRHYCYTEYNIKTGDIEEVITFHSMPTVSRCTPVLLPYSRSLLPV